MPEHDWVLQKKYINEIINKAIKDNIQDEYIMQIKMALDLIK